MQLADSFTNGLWHARSPGFYAPPWVQVIGHWRLVPDLVIITGATCLLIFVAKGVVHLKPATVEEQEPIASPDVVIGTAQFAK